MSGLNNGAAVRVGGIHKGTVKQIQLPSGPTGGMTVVMEIEQSTRKVIKQDSVAAIQTEGLLGNKYVEISFGSAEAPAVHTGDTIRSAPPVDIADLVRQTHEVLGATQEAVSNVQESTAHLKEISSKIDSGQGTLGALVNDKTAYRQLTAATAQAKAGAAAFQENMTALKHNFFVRGFFNNRGYDDSTKLTEHAIADLPKDSYTKRFAFDAKALFDKENTAKIANERKLSDAGHALETQPFGLAVVVARQGMKGDSTDARTLTQGRAMVVRDYLVNHFKMDDTRVKTIGMGKTEGAGVGEGTIEILIYPAQTTMTATSSVAQAQPRRQSAR